MHKTKMVVLSLLAVCALSAVASSTASAAGTHQWIINGTPLTTGAKEEIQGNNSTQQQQQFEIIISKLNIHLQCQVYLLLSGSQNVFEGGSIGKVKAKAEFKGCTIYQVTKAGGVEALSECRVKEPIETEEKIEGELTGPGELTLKPEKEKIFSKLTIEKTNKEASCAVEGKSNVEGGVLICPQPHFGVDLYAGIFSCAPGGSSLTFGKEPAKLYLQIIIVLEKGGKWHST